VGGRCVQKDYWLGAPFGGISQSLRSFEMTVGNVFVWWDFSVASLLRNDVGIMSTIDGISQSLRSFEMTLGDEVATNQQKIENPL
jgi:hypothetical protein